MPSCWLEFSGLPEPVRQTEFCAAAFSFCFGGSYLMGAGPGASDAKVISRLQPVEVIKILLVFFLAGYFADRWELLRELKEKSKRLPFILRGIPFLRFAMSCLFSSVPGSRCSLSSCKRSRSALIMSCALLVCMA